MIPSFQRFINFLNNNELPFILDEDLVDKLHTFLFQGTIDRIIDLSSISRVLSVPYRKGRLIFIELLNKEVLKLSELTCPECGAKIEKIDTENCQICNAEINIDDMLYVSIEGILSEAEKDKIKLNNRFERQAEAVAESWSQNGYITYLLLDLAQSELIQKAGDDIYKATLDTIRTIVYRFSLSKIMGKYLLLGEIGDCFKIAFTKVSDLFLFINEFSLKLIEFIENDKFPFLKEDILYFPCFNAVANTLDLPINSLGNNISPKDIIFSTLNGSIDFNSLSLTSLFRLDSKIKLKYEIAFKNNHLCLWIFEDLGKKIDINLESSIEFKVGKHEKAIVKKRAILNCYPNGLKQKIKEPSIYIENSFLIENDT